MEFSNITPNYVPFNNIDELDFHFAASEILINQLRENLLLLPQSNDAQKEELELSLIKSLHVLMDGFATVILSVEQGYILYDSKNCNHNKS